MIIPAALIAIASPTATQAEARAVVRIVNAARVVRGQPDRPAGRGVIVIHDGDGPPHLLKLVEFP